MEQKENPIISFIKLHPQMALTAGYLLLVFMGIIYDFELSKRVGIDILEFSGLSDLVMAPIRKKAILFNWIIMMVFLFALYRFSKWTEKHDKIYLRLNFGLDLREKPWYGTYRWTLYIFSILLYTYIASSLSASKDFKKAQKGESAELTFFTDEVRQPEVKGCLLTSTESIYVLYDTAAKKTLILNENKVNRFMATAKRPALDAAEQTIRKIMAAQEAAWNRGELSDFMEGYWASDSLCFIGSKGLTYGWQQTLENYKKGYPDKASMGTLKFTLKKVEMTGAASAFVIGAWLLERPEKGDVGGHFTLFWKKLDGKWVIVADHSS